IYDSRRGDVFAGSNYRLKNTRCGVCRTATDPSQCASNGPLYTSFPLDLHATLEMDGQIRGALGNRGERRSLPPCVTADSASAPSATRSCSTTRGNLP